MPVVQPSSKHLVLEEQGAPVWHALRRAAGMRWWFVPRSNATAAWHEQRRR